jgi:hypothetical protein
MWHIRHFFFDSSDILDILNVFSGSYSDIYYTLWCGFNHLNSFEKNNGCKS